MHPYLEVTRPHLFAHRGASGEAPENTLLAFQRAVEAGVMFLETDCHATLDGEIVLCHDSELDRTTDGTGPIRASRFAELEALDAGYRFTLDGVTFPFRDCGVSIPRLADVLAAFPEVRFNIEVKQAEPPIAEEVVRIVRGAGAEQRTLLAAEDVAVLDSLRALDPGTAIGMARADVARFFAAVDAGTLDGWTLQAHALQIPPTALGRTLVTRESVRAARHVGLAMHVWTINEPDQMRVFLDAGVDGLMSDHPARLLAVAAEYGRTGPREQSPDPDDPTSLRSTG